MGEVTAGARVRARAREAKERACIHLPGVSRCMHKQTMIGLEGVTLQLFTSTYEVASALKQMSA